MKNKNVDLYYKKKCDKNYLNKGTDTILKENKEKWGMHGRPSDYQNN